MHFGIKPWEEGRLYAFQEAKIFKAYDDDFKIKVQLAGAKIK